MMYHRLSKLTNMAGMLLFLLSILSASSYCDTITWTGATDSNWDTHTNWDTGTVPGATDEVIVTNGTHPLILNVSVTAASVSITGDTLTLNGHTMTVTGDFSTSSTGTLTMQNAADTLTVQGNISFNGGSTNTRLTEGTINAQGTFYAYYGSFAPSTNHTVTFNGTSLQTIQLDGSSTATSNSHLCNAVFANTAGVSFIATNTYITGHTTVSSGTVTGVGKNLFLGGNLTDVAAPRWQPENTYFYSTNPFLPDTIQSNVTIQANNTLSAGLTVNGNLSITNGTLDLNGYGITVIGNFSTSSSGTLTMQNTADTLNVQGDISFNGGSTNTRLTEGIINAQGTFYAYYGSFAPSTNHTVSFNGTSAQTIQLDGSSTATSNSHLCNAVFTNASGVSFLSTNTYITGNTVVSAGTVTGSAKNVYLGGNLTDTAPPRWQPENTYFYSINPILPDTIQSNVTIQANNALSAGLTVNGNLSITKGTLDLNGHTVTVNGDFSTSSTGTLTMQNVADILTVLGNTSFNGGSTHTLLTDGNINAQGTFYGYYGSFAPSTNHTVTFNGTSAQTIQLDGSSTATSNSHFYNVVIDNPSSVSLVATNTYATGTVTLSNGILNGIGKTLFIGGDLIDSVGDRCSPTYLTFYGTNPDLPANITSNVNFAGSTALPHNVTVSGSIQVISGGNLNLNGHTIAVTDDFSTGGTGVLVMQNGADSLTVQGSTDFSGGSTNTYLTHGTIYARGDFWGYYGSFAPSGSHAVVIDGTGDQSLTTEGSGFSTSQSHFQTLSVNKTGGMVTILSDLSIAGDLALSSDTTCAFNSGLTATVQGQLISGSGATPLISSTAPGSAFYNLIINGGVQVDGLKIDSLGANGLQLQNGVLTAFDNVEFSNVAGGGPHLSITHNVLSLTCHGLSFDNSFGAGFNISLNDSDGGGDVSVNLINYAGSGAGDAYEQEINGAVINWFHGLTVSSSSGGTVTEPGVGNFDYVNLAVVDVNAVAAHHYKFKNWTGTAVAAGKVGNPTSARTTVTMEGNYTLHANFELDQHSLDISSTDGGLVSNPGEGIKTYDYGTLVSVTAMADTHYHFVEWTGTAVVAGKVVSPASASTTVTMEGNYTLKAKFEIDKHSLTISSTDGGSVTVPGEGLRTYDYGALVSITATPAAHYHFVEWTGTAVTAGKVASSASDSTTVSVDGDFTLTAKFSTDQHTLSISSTAGGSVTIPGEGSYRYDYDSDVSIVASPDTDCVFDRWFGTAVAAGKVTDPTAASTNVRLHSDYSLEAKFISPPDGSTYSPLSITITDSRAALQGGVVNDGGEICEFRFVYWPEGGPKQNTAWTCCNASHDICADIVTGLLPDTRYCYQLELRNRAGIDVTWPRCFQTLAQLTVMPRAGGTVNTPGSGVFAYESGTMVSVEAVPKDANYVFVNWVGSAVDQGKVEDPNAPGTAVTVTGALILQPKFIYLQPILYVAVGETNDPQADGTVDHPFGRLQDAIDVAMDDAMIVANAGVYQEHIDLRDKNLHLIGYWRQDPNVTSLPVIEGNTNNPVVTIGGGQDPNCIIEGFHITGGMGEGIYCEASSPTIMHCLVTDNNSVGVACINSGATIDQCTVANNGPDPNGGGLCCRDSEIAVHNSILWGNLTQSIFVSAGLDPMVTYSNVQYGWPGMGNLDTDPLFMGDGYYHLVSETGCWDATNLDWVMDVHTSPCIDAGDPLSDYTDEPIPNGDCVNMGCYGGTQQASKRRITN